MEILRQKLYVSPGLKRRVSREIAKRNAKFLGKLAKLTGKRTIETGNLLAAGPAYSTKRVAKDVIQANKDTLTGIKNVATTLGDPSVKASKKLGTAASVALDLRPSTAIGKRTAQSLHEFTGKTGTDVVRDMAEFATNPAKSTGETLGKLREGGHGGKLVGGKWIGPGVNKWCLGAAPDSIVSSVGAQFEEYKGADNLRREVEAIVKSKDGRRFARTYDKRLGRGLNKIHEGTEEIIREVPNAIDTAIGRATLQPRLQPRIVPVTI